MKKIAFLLLASFLLFSCEKPEIEDPQSPTTPTVVKVDFTATVSNVTIYNGTDGKITITVTAGTAPYTYQLGTGVAQSTNIFSGLTAGSYNITVVDSKSQTLTKSVEVTQPAEVILPLVFTLSSTNVSAWGLSDGSITTNVTSGMAPYSYSLSNGPTNSTGIFTNLVAGNYTVTVTDNKQQVVNKSITITQPAKPQPVPVYTINSVASKTEISGSLNLNFMQAKNNFTISFWYNTPTVQLNINNPSYTTAFLFYTDHNTNPTGEANIQLEINKTRIECIKYKSTSEKVTLSSTTAWQGLHHIVILYDGSNLKMYFDNTLVSSTPSSISLLFNKFYIGGSYNSTYDYNGTISKFKIYDSAISADEIDYLYKN